MRDFPKLDEISFVRTREQFHTIAKIIGKVRESLVKPIAKNDNLWLNVVDKGFAMPPAEHMKNLEIGCNIESLKIEVGDSGKHESVDLIMKPFSEIAENMLLALNRLGIGQSPDLSKIVSLDIFNVNNKDSTDFMVQLYNFHWLLKEFHSRIRDGVKTQVCLWPHHFDNAFIWFSGRKINDQEEQIGMGVSNGDDSYPLPYIYMTIWPPLRTTNKLEIVEGAILHDSGWTGLILPYEAVQNKHVIGEQKKLIEDFFNTSFSSVKIGFSKR